ncbi:glycoside hydrolase [Flavobacteriaceae bacterium S0862]|nr:glycoside hydrolase [Flavobacteriaceae bacterium S0862]
MKKLIFILSLITVFIVSGCREGSKSTSDSSTVVDRENYQTGLISSIGDQPNISKAEDNIIGVTYGDKEIIYYSESIDGGESFKEPEIVGTLDGLVLGYSSGPQIAFTKSNIIITAPSKTGNLYSWSKDWKEGIWRGPYRINDIEKSVEECLSAITVTNEGYLFATWIDTRFLENNDKKNHLVSEENHERMKTIKKREENLDAMTPIGITRKQLYDKIGDIPENGHLAFHSDSEGNLLWVFKDDHGNVIKAENYEAYKKFKKGNGERLRPQGKIYVSFSKDEGKTWSKSELVYQSPDGSVCECCKPSITSDKEGNIVIMFRNNIDGSRDLHYTKSNDNGISFSIPQKLGSGTWKIDGCPMDGGGLTSFGNKGIMSTWQREGNIYTANTDLSEQLIGNGREPSISGNYDNYSVVYTNGYDVMAIHEPMTMSEKIGDGTSAKVLSTKDGVIYIWVSDKGIEYKQFNRI